jgi:FkbM family methyltransferase
MYVNPSEHIQQQLFWYGYYEKNAVLTWEIFVKPGSIAADIGANTGYYSLVAATKAKMVYAFEPAGKTRENLEENVLLNDLTNISVQSIAVSDQAGMASLYIANDKNSGMSGLQKPENFSGNTEPVKTLTLDQWISANSIVKIDCIKIDAEGSELNILKGMKNTLEQFKPVIFIEVISAWLKKFGCSPADIYLLLFGSGYRAFEIIGPGTLRPSAEQKEADTVIFIPAGFSFPEGIKVFSKVL